VDPTDLSNIPSLSVDQWSSNEEIEHNRMSIENSITARRSEDLDVEFGGMIGDNLVAHSSFTLALLERLCNAINDISEAVMGENENNGSIRKGSRRV
jgi:hypothetical protein